jgi:hypothetical protein
VCRNLFCWVPRYNHNCITFYTTDCNVIKDTSIDVLIQSEKENLQGLTLKIPLEQNPAALAGWHCCLDKSKLLLLLLLLLCAYNVKITSQKFSSLQHAYSVISRSLIHVYHESSSVANCCETVTRKRSYLPFLLKL